MARALCRAEGVDSDREALGVGGRIPRDQPYRLWQAWINEAEAALAAMKEDEAMGETVDSVIEKLAAGTVDIDDGIQRLLAADAVENSGADRQVVGVEVVAADNPLRRQLRDVSLSHVAAHKLRFALAANETSVAKPV